MLEAGMPIKAIKKALKYKLSDIDGCLISHSHKDHCKGFEDVLKTGVEGFCSADTARELKIDSPYLNIVEAGKQFEVGTFTILPFECQHHNTDGTPVTNFGYMIRSNISGEKLLFATDTYYMEYADIKGLNYIMIECSYQEDILTSNLRNNVVALVYALRLRQSHFELKHLCDWLKRVDLTECRAIYLLHFSGNNSNPKECVNKVQRITGVPVYYKRR